MYHPSIRIENRGDIEIHKIVDLFGIDEDSSFDSVEEMTEYIEGLLLGTSIFIPFVQGVTGYSDNEDGTITTAVKTIVGAKRVNAIGRYLRGDFCLTDCKYIPGLSQKAFGDLPRSLQRRIETTIVRWASVEWTDRDADYAEICDMVRRQFGHGID